MSKSKVIFGFLALGLFSLNCFSQSESITLTTYYPSPYGVYRILRLFPRSAPGACNAGELYYDDGLGVNTEGIYVCDSANSWQSSAGGGLWTLVGTDLYPTPAIPAWDVGIGTVAPEAKLHVEGRVNIGTGTGTDTGGILQVGGTKFFGVGQTAGIYVTDPWYGIYAETFGLGGACSAVYGRVDASNFAGGSSGIRGQNFSSADWSKGVVGNSCGNSGDTVGVYAQTLSSSLNSYGVYSFASSGYSGYFTGGRGVYVNGNCFATTRTGGAIDIAEYILASKSAEAGDVVVVDSDNDSSVMPCNMPYDMRVAGIVSTRPGYLLGVDQEKGNEGDVKLALCGRVPCKVITENGTIKRGDLLTTSSKPGHAMKAVFLDVREAKDFEELKEILFENEKRRNSILGKALEPLEEGEGKIVVLVTLQ